MAVDVCSEVSSSGISPRLSFSGDRKSDLVSAHDRWGRSESSIELDFDFCTSNNSFVQELSSADELFANGRILAIDIKKKTCREQQKPKTPQRKKTSRGRQINGDQKLLKEFLSMSLDDQEEKATSKSFWQFKRSNSLNCESARNNGLIRSLQFLSRSNSTGSAPNPPKQTVSSSKETQKPSLRKQSPVPRRKSSSAPNAGAFYPYCSNPQLRKSGSQGSGVKFNPVLNIPSPYISTGTIGLFSSIFCSAKFRKKKSTTQ